jgi:hypothetical protein
MSRNSLRSLVACGLLVAWSGLNPCGAVEASKDLAIASHKQVRVIQPSLDDSTVQLKTFAKSPSGELWLCCELRSTDSDNAENSPGCILVYSVEGELLRSINLAFVPQAINFSKDEVPFVAGSGKVARLMKSGEIDLAIDAPNILPDEELKEKLAAKNQETIDRLVQSFETRVKRLETQIATLEEELASIGDDEKDKRLKDRTETRLSILKSQFDSQKEIMGQQKEMYQQMFSAESMIARIKLSTGIAVSDSEVFVSLPSTEGQGYAIYRMTHDLTDAAVVVDDLRGCCGQLDIQTDGTHLVVAENTSFKVRYFDREGTEVKSFGERSGSGASAIEGWGSCCNPMNVRCLDDGDVLVAESSIGHIKRYSPDGKFLGLVGTAKIAGGCKHVAIARDTERDWYFMMNTSGNNIAVLVPLSEAPGETEDERESRLAMEGLGQKMIGAWKAEPSKEEEAKEDADPSEDSIGQDFDFGAYLMNQNRYLNLGKDGSVSRREPVKAKPAAEVSKPAASKGLFGSIVSLLSGSGASESAATEYPEEVTKWVAIRQNGDVLHMGLVESGVQNYTVAVRFIDDTHAEFKWYYDEVAGEPMATVSYKKVAGAAEEKEACADGTCKDANCDKADCKHGTTEPATPPDGEVPASEAVQAIEAAIVTE